MDDCSLADYAYPPQLYEQIPEHWWPPLLDLVDLDCVHPDADPYEVVAEVEDAIRLVVDDPAEVNVAASHLIEGEDFHAVWARVERENPRGALSSDQRTETVFMVTGEIWTDRRKHRVGKDWARHHETGMVIDMVPGEMILADYKAWVVQEAYRQAAALLRAQFDADETPSFRRDEAEFLAPMPDADFPCHDPELQRVAGYEVEVSAIDTGIDPRAVLDVLVNDLTASQRRAVDLLLEGLDYPEIAHRLGISHDTVRKHRSNAVRRIRARLKRHGV